MTAVATQPVIDSYAEELYDRLHDLVGRGGSLTYTAQEWLPELLRPLGYEASDQSRVSHCLRALTNAGLVRKESVKSTRGYHASRRRNYPRPRRVTITVLR